MNKCIVFFSWSNNTKELVDEINKKIDTYRVERLIPYSKNYDRVAYVEAKEERDRRTLPEIKELNVDFNQYDVILLFFPIWWYTFPMSIGTFVSKLNDYKGRIFVFCNSYTNDPIYLENAYSDLKRINKNIKFKKGLINKPVEEIKAFIEKIK